MLQYSLTTYCHKALKFLYVNVNDCYFVENEGIQRFLASFLTFAGFMAHFFCIYR